MDVHPFLGSSVFSSLHVFTFFSSSVSKLVEIRTRYILGQRLLMATIGTYFGRLGLVLELRLGPGTPSNPPKAGEDQPCALSSLKKDPVSRNPSRFSRETFVSDEPRGQN